jgi:hypothetical protein
VAIFESKEQLLSYVRWTTLSEPAGVHQIENRSALASYHRRRHPCESLTKEDAVTLEQNRSPSMV